MSILSAGTGVPAFQIHIVSDAEGAIVLPDALGLGIEVNERRCCATRWMSKSSSKSRRLFKSPQVVAGSQMQPAFRGP
jgi:hypothetical protein